MNFAKAIEAVLRADATLTALLSTHGGNPAIFPRLPVPSGFDHKVAPGVFIALEGNSAADPDGEYFFARGVSAEIQVVGYCRAYNKRTSTIEDVAERVRYVLHRTPFEITVNGETWRSFNVTASGPIITPTDSTLDGRLVTVTAKFEKDN